MRTPLHVALLGGAVLVATAPAVAQETGDVIFLHPDGTEPITAASGAEMSIAMEAMAAGKAVGLVQTGHIAEPGTGVFVASNEDRGNQQAIAADVVEAGRP